MLKLLLILLIIYNVKLIEGTNENIKICTCDFIDKLNFIPKRKIKILCNIEPHHGDEIKILANSDYEVSCFKNSKVYCPLKNYYLNNSDITKFSPKLKYDVNEMTNDKNISIYHLIIDKDASSIMFYCYIKPKQVSALLKGVVKVNLKRQVRQEYSKVSDNGIHFCDFSKGNLNINPSAGYYSKNSRSVTCIYRVIPNQMFLIKLPKLNIVIEQFLPGIVNCLSEYNFINFTLKYVEETDDSTIFHIIFGAFKKAFNLSCTMDLSEYAIEPCSLGKKGIVTLLFTI